MEDMGVMEEWLSTILGESTKSAYQRGISYFLEFTGLKRVEDLKTLEKPEVRIVQFFTWLQKEKGLSANSARARCVPVQSIYNFMGLKLNLRHRLPEITAKVEKWRPSLEQLQKIYANNDLLVKCWMSLSRDVPARIGDLLTVTSEQIQSGEFDLLSKKEKVLGRCYVSDQTKELFKQLEASGLKLPTTSRGIGLMMEKASKLCGFPILNQHKWRKIFASKCLDLGISETAWKFLLFKSVHSSDRTYLMNSSSLREQWQKVVDAIPLASNGNGKTHVALEELKNALAKAEDERRAEKTRREQTEERLEKVLAILAKKNIELPSAKGIDPTIHKTLTKDNLVLAKFIEEVERKQKEKAFDVNENPT